MLCAKNPEIAREQTLLVARRKCMAKSSFHAQKGILERDQQFLAVVLSQMDLENFEIRKM